jgi:hypothetical protein
MFEFKLHCLAELEIKGAEGFVKEEDLGFFDEGAGEGDALLLAAGELAGAAIFEAVEFDEGEGIADAGTDLGFGEVVHFEAEGDVFGDGEVGEEGVVLEDGVDGAMEGGAIAHRFAMNEHVAIRRRFKPGNHP